MAPSTTTHGKEGWERHARGWQLAVVALGTALGGAVLALPRPVIPAPSELPLPVVDRAEQRELEERAADLVRAARATPLPFLVRAAGEAFRRFGQAEANGEADELPARDFRARVVASRKQFGDVPVLTLRAVQADLFARAVTRRNAADLKELGGTFFARAGSAEALLHSGLQDDELRSLFTMRWTKLAGLLDTRPFTPTLNEWRLYYRTLLAHAELGQHAASDDPMERIMPLARCIDALTKYDPDYPRLLALGIVEQWMGHRDAAEALLSAHLEAHPSGPWFLRARNYLLAAHRGLNATPPR
jgi:hypothetical protein